MNKRKFIKNIWITVAFLVPVCFLGQNPFEMIASLCTVPVLFYFFWRPGEPPVLLFGFMLQWLSISIKLFYGLYLNQPLEEVLPNESVPETILLSFYLSLIGLNFFTLGTYLAIRSIKQSKLLIQLEEATLRYSARKVFFFYISYYFFVSLLFTYRFIIPGLNSFIVVFDQLKWGFFIITFYLVHKQKKFRAELYLMIAFQFIIGFGFFSNFKESIFFVLIGIMVVAPKFSLKQNLLFFLTFLFLFRVGVIWTAVKGEYRNFLSGGERSQAVVVSTEQSLSKFFDLVISVKKEDTQFALNAFVSRISYINYFSLTLRRVPTEIPYERGKILKEAIQRVLLPRILFPNKPIIDDSEHTSYYTGRNFTGGGEASFSLGYTADAYIDFGPVWMFIPIFLLGLILGWMYKTLLTNSRNVVWGIVFTAPFYFFSNVYGMNTNKVIGFLCSYFILIYITKNYIIKYVNPFLQLNDLTKK